MKLVTKDMQMMSVDGYIALVIDLSYVSYYIYNCTIIYLSYINSMGVVSVHFGFGHYGELLLIVKFL